MYTCCAWTNIYVTVDNVEARMQLTELQIKSLPPQCKRYVKSDGRGLALEVMPTGAASWRYRYQFKGKTEKVSLEMILSYLASITCAMTDGLFGQRP